MNALSDSRKYSTRGRYRQYIIHMQKANVMVERIKVDPSNNLEVIDDVGMEFLIRSQTIHERWCAVNLGIESCEYEDRMSICKHLLAVKKLVDKEFTYLKCILSVEENGFVDNLNDMGEDDVVFHLQSPKLNHVSPSMDDIGVQLAQLNDLYVELGRDFFTTDQMRTVGVEHIENAIRRLNAIKNFNLP